MKPLKVAILTTDKRDHDRDYENPTPGFGTAPAALLQGFELLPEVEVHVVSCVHRAIASPARIGRNLFYHSLVVPRLGWMRTLYVGCVRAARQKLRELQPDIVHGQGTELDCALNAVRSGFPNVITIHGNMQAIARLHAAKIGSFYWLADWLETFALRRTDGVFCNSAYTEKFVASRARRVWRVPNALRLDFFETPVQSHPVRRPVLLNIGVLQPRKQQLELLGMAANLHRRGLDFEIQFAGELSSHTDYGAAFARRLEAAEKAGYARHLGRLDTAQLIAAMDAASGLVHFPTEEAFGLVVAEAMTRNLKLFGAATGGMVDICDGISGAELVATGDFNALEDKIAGWLQAGGSRTSTGAILMRKRYHPQVIARRHMEIYREVLGSG